MTATSHGTNRASIARTELIVAVAITVAALVLHALFLTQSGPLWRDEINSLNLSRLELGGIWQNLEHESFPIGWLVLLKGWTSFTPNGDLPLRVIGVVTGLALIAAVWFAGWSMTGRAPVLAIALLLFDAGTVRFGDSIRGYGAGMLFAVLVYWSLWRLATRRDSGSFWIAVAASTLSVHLIYHNTVVVFAACVGAAVTGAVARSARDVVRPLLVGAIAAASLLPYRIVFARVDRWNELVRYDIGPEWIHWMWGTSHAGSGPFAIILWDLVVIAAVVAAVVTLSRKLTARPVATGAGYHAVVFLAGTCAYVAFLFALSYYMAPWYYLALSLLVALSADALFGSLAGPRARVAIVVVALAHLAAALVPAVAFTSERLTNADLIANDVALRTRSGDLVIVTPWQGIISWDRYHHGPARSVSLPPVSFTDWHRYDLFLRAMDDPSATARLFDDIDATLARGSKVFVVRNIGGSPRVPKNPPLPRVPHQDDSYAQLESHVRMIGARLVDLEDSPAASEYERFALMQIRFDNLERR